MIRFLNHISCCLTKEMSGIFTCFSDDFSHTLAFVWLIITRSKNSVNNVSQLLIRESTVLDLSRASNPNNTLINCILFHFFSMLKLKLGFDDLCNDIPVIVSTIGFRTTGRNV